MAMVCLALASTCLANESDLSNPVAVELETLFSEDQADRIQNSTTPIDWEEVSVRDEKRELRIKELLALAPLGSGTEYYHAAMILQHATTPEDYLLAHDLCVIAIGKGEQKAKWLAAASLDRFLVSIGRPQRFGTQYSSKFSHPPSLVQVDPNISDALRKEFDVPSLEDAKKRESEMVKSFNESRKKQSSK